MDKRTSGRDGHLIEDEDALAQPGIAGASFHRLRGTGDYPRLAAVHAGCRDLKTFVCYPKPLA